MTEPGKSERTSFWKTLPGVLTAVAGLITAIAGLIAALNLAGVIGQSSQVTTATAELTPSLATTQPEAGQTDDTGLPEGPNQTDDTGLPEGPTSDTPTIVRIVDVPTELLLGIAVGENALWVTTNENMLFRIDPINGDVTGSVPVGTFPLEVATGAGSVWVANADDGTVSRVDPVTLVVTDTYVVGSFPGSLAIGAGAVWTDGGQSVWRIDLESGEITNIDVGFDTFCVAVGAEAVWVCAPELRSVLRLDLADLTVTDTIPVGNFPKEIAIGHDAVWVADEGGELVRIDLRDLDVRQIGVGEFPQYVAASQEAVWVLGDSLERVDPESLAVASIPVQGVQGLAVGFGSVWIGDKEDRSRVLVVQ
jgi:hypothetical protein